MRLRRSERGRQDKLLRLNLYIDERLLETRAAQNCFLINWVQESSLPRWKEYALRTKLIKRLGGLQEE